MFHTSLYSSSFKNDSSQGNNAHAIKTTYCDNKRCFRKTSGSQKKSISSESHYWLFGELNIEIVLAYYPLYHSKYNSIERSWGILENHWSGTLLNSIKTTLEWAKTMTWEGLNPTVKLLEITYKKGVTICKKRFKVITARLERHINLSKYYVTIKPQVG